MTRCASFAASLALAAASLLSFPAVSFAEGAQQRLARDRATAAVLEAKQRRVVERRAEVRDEKQEIRTRLDRARDAAVRLGGRDE